MHLIRNTFRLSGRQHWDALKHDLKPIYTAPTEAAAHAGLDDLAEHWGERYPAIIRLWTNAWQEFIPFLDYDTEIRRVLCSTNAIESLNARYRRAVKARGHFPTEAAALKRLYLVTRSLDPTGKGQARWIVRWKPPQLRRQSRSCSSRQRKSDLLQGSSLGPCAAGIVWHGQ